MAFSFGGFGTPSTTPTTTPSLFGSPGPGTTTGGLFGTQPGTTAPSLFGTPASTTTNSLFPGMSQPFGQPPPAQPGLFGTPTPSAQTPTTPSLFGSPTPAPSLFSPVPSSTPATSSPFPSLFSGSTTATTTPSLFGFPSTSTPSTTTPSLFGSPTSTPSLFSGGASSPFGASTATPSLFGATPQVKYSPTTENDPTLGLITHMTITAMPSLANKSIEELRWEYVQHPTPIPPSSPFGLTSTTPGTTSPFGLPSTTTPSPFGLPSTTPGATSPFGLPPTTSTTSPFGLPSTTSPFGLPSTPPTSTSLFSTPSLFPGTTPTPTPSLFPSVTTPTPSLFPGITPTPSLFPGTTPSTPPSSLFSPTPSTSLFPPSSSSTLFSPSSTPSIFAPSTSSSLFQSQPPTTQFGPSTTTPLPSLFPPTTPSLFQSSTQTPSIFTQPSSSLFPPTTTGQTPSIFTPSTSSLFQLPSSSQQQPPTSLFQTPSQPQQSLFPSTTASTLPSPFYTQPQTPSLFPGLSQPGTSSLFPPLNTNTSQLASTMFNNIQVPQSPVAQVTQPQQQPQQQEPPTPYASLPRFNNLPKREDTATPRFHVSLSALSSPRSNSSPSQEEGGIHTTLYSAPTSPIRTQTFPLRPKKTPSSPETQNHPKVTVDEGLAKLTLSPKPKNDKETSLYIKPQQIESTKAEDQPQQPPPTPSQNYITPVRVDTLEGLQSNASTESPQGKGSEEVHEESAQSNSKEPPASPLPSNSEVRAKISSLKSHSSPLPSPQKSPSSNPRAPSLSKPGYSTIPHLNSLKGMSDEELSRVENFSVLCEGVGQVTFLGPTDLRNVDIDSAVQFGHMSLTVYPNNKYGSEPPVGQGLNKPAEVTLYNCFPASGRDVKRLVHYSRKIAETTERLGATLVDYNAMTGTWVFQVKHFSTYGIEWTSEDEREAGDEAADQEDREEPIDTDNIEEEKEELFLEVKDENESTEDTVQLDNTATHMESSEMQNITAFSQSSFSKTASLSTTTESTLPKETLHSKYTDEVPCSVFPPNVQALTEYIQSLGVSQSERRYCVERDYPIVMPRVSWSPGGMFAIVTNSDYHLHLLSTSQVISLPPVEPCLKMLKSHLKSSGLSDPHDEMHGSQDMNESTSQKENMKTFTLYKDRLDEHISENSLNFPDGTPHKTLWELVKSLWGTIPEENSFDLQFSRRLALSKWLSRTLRMKKHTKLPSQNTTSGLLDEIFDLCSRNMISEAVQVAQQAKLNRLAVLIALSGGDPQRSRLLLEQQQGWLAGGKPAIVSDKIARLYKLLGGSTGDSDVERGMTWEQQFGFHMWFSTPPNRSTRSAIQNYVTTPTLIRPQSQTNKEYLDINYQLLALYAKGPEFVSNEESLSVDLLQALHPEGLVKCICDIQQTWFLQSVLCVLGYQMDILQYWRLYSWFAWQLCELGHWEWAIYVLLNIPQVSRETEWYLQKAIQKILDLHVAQGVNLPESLAGESSWADNFPYSEKLLAPKTLTEKLSFLHWLKCIPSQWLLRAEANSICTNDQDALLQKVNYLIQAEDFIEAHELLIAQVVPIVVVCGTKSYGDFKAETHLLAKLDDALQALSEHRHEIDQWGSGGSVVMEFMDLTSRMDPAELPNVPLDRYSTLLSKLKLWEDRVRIREGRELRLHCTPPLEGNLSQARLCVTILMTRTIKQLLRGRFSNNAEGASGGSTSRQEAISILSTLVNLPLPSDIRAKFHSHFSSIYTDTAYATFNNKNKV